MARRFQVADFFVSAPQQPYGALHFAQALHPQAVL
jgi:hypothetical protein